MTRFPLDSGRSKAVSMRMAVSPRCRSDAGPEAGGRAPKSPGAGQGQREHLIQHRSTLRLRAAPSNVLLALQRLNSVARNYRRLCSVIPKFPSPCFCMIFLPWWPNGKIRDRRQEGARGKDLAHGREETKRQGKIFPLHKAYRYTRCPPPPAQQPRASKNNKSPFTVPFS